MFALSDNLNAGRWHQPFESLWLPMRWAIFASHEWGVRPDWRFLVGPGVPAVLLLVTVPSTSRLPLNSPLHTHTHTRSSITR